MKSLKKVIASVLALAIIVLSSPLTTMAASTGTATISDIVPITSESQNDIQKEKVETSGVKSFFVKLAIHSLTWSIRHGESIVERVLLKYADKKSASTFYRYASTIAEKLDQLAELPDITAEIAKTKLYSFMVGTLGINGGVAMVIADGVKYAINFLL
ncbi:MAG: hypothetical protein ACXVC1_03925 [Tumebacillaceae bacterium]